MDVTVVIPCYNGAATLAAQLDAVLAQETSASFDVLVADNGSTDGSADVAERRLGPAGVVDAGDVRGINHARNRGCAAATAPLVVFCDSDDRVHPGWIEAYWVAFNRGARLMGGPLRRVSADGREVVLQDHFNDSLGFLPWPMGANFAVAREVLDQCGPFDESYRGGGDETELAWRAQLAGHELVLVPGAVVDYTMREPGRDVLRQNVGFGRSHVRLYSAFAARGMPRQPTRLPRSFLRLLVRALRRPSASRRRQLTACGGQLAGRFLESCRQRTFYV